MPLAPTIAAYFVAAPLLWLLGSRLPRWAPALALAPFAGQAAFVVSASASWDGAARFETVRWIPSLGVSLDVRIDVLTILLTAMVVSVGAVILVYSARYFSEPARRSRFLSLMVLFTGGMAGIVAADNVFGLFVFWEITTVASFLLIGFDDERAPGRAAAVQAVLVTTAGGLAMLAGLVLLADEAGTTSITEIVASPPSGTTATVALGLVFLGAFTKSAQFPFHFWLPGAMAAPTPASAYLHSATMVKAGIVLLILLAPGFSGETIWVVAVTGVGLATMTLGALAAMRQHDAKLLLAYGTVSQLGFMTALLGVGLTAAALATLVAHSLFKAGLFLVVGIVDKVAGSRDLRRLSGLGRSQPALALVAGSLALSMAGIPPLLGFVTKEASFDLLIGEGRWPVLVIIAAASMVTVAYTARFWWGAFGNGAAGSTVASNRPLDRVLLGSAGVFAAASLVFGVLPGWLGSAAGDATGQILQLKLWPGWKPALAVSTVVVAAGLALFAAGDPAAKLPPRWRARVRTLHVPSAQGIYRATIRALNRTADGVTGVMQNGSLPRYLVVILMTIVTVPTVAWLSSPDGAPAWTPANGPAEVALAAAAVAAAVAATRVQRRMAAALLLGVVGYAVAGIYVTFGAPDLALTQLLIETFTVALFAFVLALLPRRFGAGPRSVSAGWRIATAATVGAFVTGAALLATSTTPDRAVADFYVDNAVEAGGRNVVNVILTDFRALDTLGEITVLAAAVIGITALVRVRRGRAAAEVEG